MKKKILITLFLFVILSCSGAVNAKSEDNLATPATKYPNYGNIYSGKDKFERFNRKTFMLNLKVNRYILRPVNVLWCSIMPQYGLDRIQSLYNNIKYPVSLAGCLAEKDFKSAKSETKRFFINTTVGVLGLYDRAQSKYNIAPHREDFEQALAMHNVKQGPYLVVPFVTQGNIRDIAGELLDAPFNPCSYMVGPISAISSGVAYLNNSTTTVQPVAKYLEDNYADPYDVARKLHGMDLYIKTKNYDRTEVLDEIIREQNVYNVSSQKQNYAASVIKPDIQLENYKSQGQIVDSLRTIIFDNEKLGSSKWSDLSLWNKTFKNQLKVASVKLDPNRPKYKYRYILQKDKNSPVAIIYPSIGENALSDESAVMAKILYNQGYSVVIFGSTFQWQFVRSMPDSYRPGIPSEDAKYLRDATAVILNNLQAKNECLFSKKIVVGCSFGGITSLFVSQQEAKENVLGISKYLVICPPIDLFFALQQLDDYSTAWMKNSDDIKRDAAVASEKVVQATHGISEEKFKDRTSSIMPLTTNEAELAISFALHQKLSDVLFTIENGSPYKKSNLYEMIDNMSYYDYAQKYLLANRKETLDQLSYDASLYSISDYLRAAKNIKIYHSMDDMFTNQDQLAWLKNQTGNKAVIFSNGSHLGFLYRKEFYNQFIKDIKL